MNGTSSQPVWRSWPACAWRATESAPRTSGDCSAFESMRLDARDIEVQGNEPNEKNTSFVPKHDRCTARYSVWMPGECFSDGRSRARRARAQVQLGTLDGELDRLGIAAVGLPALARFLTQAIELLVGVQRIVVEEHGSPGAGAAGEPCSST